MHINRDPHLLGHCQDTRGRLPCHRLGCWAVAPGFAAWEFGGPPWIWPGLDGVDSADGMAWPASPWLG